MGNERSLSSFDCLGGPDGAFLDGEQGWGSAGVQRDDVCDSLLRCTAAMEDATNLVGEGAGFVCLTCEERMPEVMVDEGVSGMEDCLFHFRFHCP